MRASLAAVLLLMAAQAQVSLAQNNANLKTVTVTGRGDGKDAAMADAKRRAVEEGAGSIIYSESQTRDFQLIKDTVLARSAGFIQDVRELGAGEEDGIYWVKIEATVSIQGIVEMWGTVKNLLQSMGRPKIMVWVTEKIGDELVEDSTVQARIENILLESGFLLVDRERIKQLIKREQDIAVLEDKPEQLIALMKKEGAQIFITGSANATGRPQNTGGMQLFAYEAEANMRCYNADTGQLVSRVPGKPTRGVQREWRSAAKQALDFQGKQIAPVVQENLLQFWMDWLGGIGELILRVEGVSFSDYVELEEQLKQLPDIKDINVEYSNDMATFSIQSQARALDIAKEIAKKIKTLKISDVSANVIKATYKPAQ